MNLKKNIKNLIFFLSLLFVIISFFNIKVFAKDSSVFFNIGAFFNRTIIVGYSYYLFPELALRVSLEFLLTTGSGYVATASIIILGVQFFFQNNKDYYLLADLGLGSIEFVDYVDLAILFKFVIGYRFLFNSFFIDLGISFGGITTSISNFSETGLLIEIGFLF